MTLRSTLLAAGLAAGIALPASAQSVLRVVPHADLRTLDPVAVSVVITRMHGLMIYETLFAWDQSLTPQPQMVDTWSVSDDQLTWRFTLRDGLAFHDGKPVTTRDVAASLRRWMSRDTVGSRLGDALASLDIVDDKTFTMVLKRPFGLMTYALGSAVGQIPAIMREEDARTDAGTPISTTVGSGPFRFVREQWMAGQRVVYEKNLDYRPRSEPPSGLAGGRVVKVDRVEWRNIPDASTVAAAMQAGEIDIWEQVATDLVPVVSRQRGTVVDRLNTLGTQGMLRPNSLHAPFNDPRARLALAYVVNQADAMAAGFGDERWWKRCGAFFVCGTAYASEAGSDAYATPNIERARSLMAEAGYRGERLVFVTTNDIPWIGRMAEVVAAGMRQAGMNVDLQYNDWGTVITRQPRKDPPDQGGYNLFVTGASGATMFHPLTNIGTNMSCDGRNWAGWPCDEEAEKLRAAFIDATNDADRKRIAEQLQRRLAEMQPYIVLGQADVPYARRANIEGVLAAPVMVFWNVEKK
ncbi:ABC transporter substrate-binding protein [Elioraea rosea]|uniref:ABC transporter substrate-binding protein n=1 Tax=Elioraea rosea TaxID=2492390 RepID=UPI001184609A|nr:ABC transporter substrate-binding protein [Elioraea rosea]